MRATVKLEIFATVDGLDLKNLNMMNEDSKLWFRDVRQVVVSIHSNLILVLMRISRKPTIWSFPDRAPTPSQSRGHSVLWASLIFLVSRYVLLAAMPYFRCRLDRTRYYIKNRTTRSKSFSQISYRKVYDKICFFLNSPLVKTFLRIEDESYEIERDINDIKGIGTLRVTYLLFPGRTNWKWGWENRPSIGHQVSRGFSSLMINIVSINTEVFGGRIQLWRQVSAPDVCISPAIT